MPLVLSALCIGLLFFFMIVRPQKKNISRHQDMLAQLSTGDDVITSGGLYGKVISMDDESVELEVADNCIVKVAKRSIAMKKVHENNTSGPIDSSESV